MKFNERKREILKAIVREYVRTASPVGSRSVAKNYDLGVSSATIRNEMADLEEMGYVEQPHTSAGRIPTDRGYRFFVDRLMEEKSPDRQQLERIEASFRERVREVDALMKKATQILSRATACLTLISKPELTQSRFKYLQVLPWRPGQGLLILVTNHGLVDKAFIDLPPNVTQRELNQISWALNKRLSGLTLNEIGLADFADLYNELAHHRQVVEAVLRLVSEEAAESSEHSVYLGGTHQILTQPEFKDLEQARKIFAALEEEDLVQDLLEGKNGTQKEVRITIGKENEHEEIRPCSVVTTSYHFGDETGGRLGIIGPKRMDYARVLPLVRYVRFYLSCALLEQGEAKEQ